MEIENGLAMAVGENDVTRKTLAAVKLKRNWLSQPVQKQFCL